MVPVNIGCNMCIAAIVDQLVKRRYPSSEMELTSTVSAEAADT